MYEDLKSHVVSVAKRTVAAGLAQERAGNFSLRVPGTEHILITPTRIHREVLTTDDIPVVDLFGRTVEGKKAPSSETPMHTLVYRARPDVGGVVHTHSPYATCFALLNREIPPIVIEAAHFGGSVKVAPYALPGSDALGDSVLSTLGNGNAVLMQYHGVLTCAETLDEALVAAVYVEDVARLYHLALSLGDVEPMPPEIMQVMLDRRRKRQQI